MANQQRRSKTLSQKHREAKTLIEKAFDAPLFLEKNQSKVLQVIKDIIEDLESGLLRVCIKQSKGWITQEWLKKAILLHFKTSRTWTFDVGGAFTWRDKVFPRNWHYDEPKDGIRVVPPAVVRKGAYIAPNVVIMPSFVNIGAFVDKSSMIDTWATVGSCAQIGKGVHLSGGVGIGGVLEPLQASPVIIEDHVFVGSRCVIVEGVHVERGAVLGAGVVLTASTPIIDVTKSQSKIFKKRVPKNAIVIPGVRPKDFPGGQYHIPCALIIGKRSAKTDQKTALTEALRQTKITSP